MGTNFKRPYSIGKYLTNEFPSVNELIADMCMDPCRYYNRKNNKVVENIIIYRNALNERELNSIIDKEINELMKNL